MGRIVFGVIGAVGAIVLVQLYRYLRDPHGARLRRKMRANLIAAAIAVVGGVVLAELIAPLSVPDGAPAPGSEEAVPLRNPVGWKELPEGQKSLLIAGLGALCIWILLSNRD